MIAPQGIDADKDNLLFFDLFFSTAVSEAPRPQGGASKIILTVLGSFHVHDDI